MSRSLVRLLVVLALPIGLGCASANIDSQNYVEGEAIAKPPVILVYNFALTAEDVVSDTLGSEFTGDRPASGHGIIHGGTDRRCRQSRARSARRTPSPGCTRSA